jgi:hypothetical protein
MLLNPVAGQRGIKIKLKSKLAMSKPRARAAAYAIISNALEAPPLQIARLRLSPHCEPVYGNLRMGVRVTDSLRVPQLADAK